MLEFLPLALSAMSAISSMRNTAKGYQPTQAETAQLQDMANRDRLLKAMTDPNDSILKNITAGENQYLNSNTQQQLSNLLAANRKAQLMGRQTYFNPERQDESISQFLTKSADNNANTARSNALQRILQAANGYSSSASGYGGMVQNQQAAQNMNREKQSTLFGMGTNATQPGGSLSNIFQMLSQGGGQQNMGAAMPWLSGAA